MDDFWTRLDLNQLTKNVPGHSKELNFFKVEASQPLSVWIKKGWIHPQDPRGWFQWYCRYYIGRRTEDDERQIKRWVAIKRHVAQIKKTVLHMILNAVPSRGKFYFIEHMILEKSDYLLNYIN